MQFRRHSGPTFFCWACVATALVFSATLLEAVRSAKAAETETAEKAATVTEANAAEAAAAESRTREFISFLASDALEGRGVDTQGINKAADFLAEEFRKLGLKTDLYDGTPFQKFTMKVGAELGAKNLLAIVGPPGSDGKPRRYELKLGTDYTPLSVGGSGKIDVPLAFVGYGITVKPREVAAAPVKDDKAKDQPEPDKKVDEKKIDDKKTDVPTPDAAAAAELKQAAEKKAAPEAKKPADPHAVDPHAAMHAFAYDDYAGVDVKGKVIVALRHEPEQNNPHSMFNGTDVSPHAPFTRKLANAYDHGAAAAVFVTDAYDIKTLIEGRQRLWQQAVDELAAAHADFKKIKKPTDAERDAYRKQVDELAEEITAKGKQIDESHDPLLTFDDGGPSGGAGRLPTVHVRRAVIDRILAEAGKPTLAALEKKIDEGPQPQSFVLDGWRLEGEIDVREIEAEVKNVVAVLEGEGPLADETIVIGAHYDHLGHGGQGSFVPKERAVHNGADDNASGTTALLETARRLAALPKKLPRRIVFIAFTGEERGLIGSARYCKEPLFPLEQTVAMLNMDMVGRLQDEKLTIYGTDTATEFKPLVDELNESKFHFKVSHVSGGSGPSDHASFYAKKIPVIHYFTGTHVDYHRPSDDADKVNLSGLVRIAELVSASAVKIAETEKKPTYVEVAASMHGGSASGSGRGNVPYLGSIPDYSQEQPGVLLQGVQEKSPAQKGGLRGGDVIVKFGDMRVGSVEDFMSALSSYKIGDKVDVVVKREGAEKTLSVTLGERPKK